jgi:vacuolar-type H+-ATPase subunit H
VEAELGEDLDRLLEAERRLAARLEEARAAASRVLEGARSEATALARHAEEDERTGRARIEAEVTAELEAEFRRIEAEAERRIQVYTRVSGDRLRELSLFVLHSLLEHPSTVQR